MVSATLPHSKPRSRSSRTPTCARSPRWAAITAVPTALAGVYGMNFDYMPELHWKSGYPLVVAIILAVWLLLYRIFRKNQWL